MSYAVDIRNNATGEVRRFNCDCGWDDGSSYLWTDGNFGCDCNLEQFFREAAGEDADDEIACSDTRYTPIRALLPDGSEINLQLSHELLHRPQ